MGGAPDREIPTPGGDPGVVPEVFLILTIGTSQTIFISELFSYDKNE